MSGSELMEEIEKVTGWKPSPESIYPLLRKLRRDGSIERVESDVPGLKPFKLTDKGKEELRRYEEREALLMRDKYYSIRRTYWKLIRGMDEELYEASSGLFAALEEVHSVLKEKGESSEKVQSILNLATEAIKEVKRQTEKE